MDPQSCGHTKPPAPDSPSGGLGLCGFRTSGSRVSGTVCGAGGRQEGPVGMQGLSYDLLEPSKILIIK